MASEAARPTRKQLSYLRRLAEQTGTTFTPPATRAQASHEIERLKARPSTPAAERRRERRAVQDAMASRGPASSVRREETSGYGSNCRWSRDDRQAGEGDVGDVIGGEAGQDGVGAGERAGP